ncbi:invasion associated locus B family protein [Agrobacterium salinitolerans]|nr:invasion associated locus B family protein [Agrobacterium salinitolerans]
MKNHILAAAVALIALPGLANAAEVFENWSVEKVDGRCTAWTKPVTIEGEQRDGAYLSIVNVPGEGIKNSVAFSFGKTGAGKAQASANVDGKTFELLTFDTAAFAASGTPEAELISAMRRGSEAAVNWTEADGSISKDTYSLKGFTAARSKIDSDCR